MNGINKNKEIKINKMLEDVRKNYETGMSIARVERMRRDYEDIIQEFTGKRYIILNPHPYMTAEEARINYGPLDDD